MKTIAIDVGSGYTNVVADGKRVSFPSLAARIDEDRIGRMFHLGGDRPETVRVGEDGPLYVTGESAGACAAPREIAPTLRDDWGGSDPWLALLYAGLARVGFTPGETLRLATGLPQALYGVRRNDLVRRLVGRHVFEYQGRSWDFEIESIEVLPQPVAAILAQAAHDESVLDAPCGVVDIGTYTTDFSVVEEMRVVQYLCGGVNIGVSRLLDALAETLEAEFGYTFDRNRLHKVIREGHIRYRGKQVDVRETVEKVGYRTFLPVLERLDSAWGGAVDMDVFLAGGGGPVCFDVVRRRIPHAQLAADPFWAVAEGLFVYATKVSED